MSTYTRYKIIIFENIDVREVKKNYQIYVGQGSKYLKCVQIYFV
jgi:hypothetical protein